MVLQHSAKYRQLSVTVKTQELKVQSDDSIFGLTALYITLEPPCLVVSRK
jgi:hypothetical protein